MSTEATTAERFNLTPPFRLLNWAGEQLERLHLHPVDLSPDDLIATALHITKQTSFDDTEVLEGFRLLLDDYRRNDNLTLVGRLGLRSDTLRRMTNHLDVQGLFQQHPEVGEVPIHRPLFIVGFLRTGTTLLHRLLAQDPAAHAPPLWQLLKPLPLNVRARELKQRVRSARNLVALSDMLVPQLRAIHEIEADQPEECVFALSHSLLHYTRSHTPGYQHWLLQTEQTANYQHYRRALQALRWQQPERRLILKTPYHMWMLNDLLTAFPDACIVQTHRDPRKMFPSLCSLIVAVRRIHERHVDHAQIAQEWKALCLEGLERMTTIRDARGDSQFYDLDYQSLVSNPLEAIHGLYNHFGIPLGDAAKQRMETWLHTNLRPRTKPHRYSADLFQLDEAELLRDFEHYIHRYDVRLE
jgi:hypothetical protein